MSGETDPRPEAIWETLARWRTEARSFALLTVIETRGFTPQKTGAHMLVDDRGDTFGTIGGGAIEHEALAEARRLLEAGSGTLLVKRHLTQELGMCCGGEMAIHVEVIESSPRLVVFGAGYIAKPLAAMAASCGFRVAVIDDRAEWLTLERFPAAERILRAPEEFLRELDSSERDFAVITTHDHALDQRLVDGLLRRPLAFLGMIGSVPKQRKFALRLRARGFGDAEIARVRTPLGVAIGASTPEEIAVSVLAELIAVRRGAALTPRGWTPPEREPRGADAQSRNGAEASSRADSTASETMDSRVLDQEEKRS